MFSKEGEKYGVELDKWERWEDVEKNEGGKTVIRNILYEKNQFSIKSVLVTKAFCDDYIRIVPEYAQYYLRCYIYILIIIFYNPYLC